MINIIINGDLGITLDNMPAELFSIASNVNENADRGPTFHVDETHVVLVVDTISRAVRVGGNEIDSTRTGSTVIIAKRAEAVQGAVPTTEAAPPILDLGDAEDDGQEAVDEEEEEENEENNFTAGVIGPQVSSLPRLEEDKAIESLAGALETEVSSDARNLRDKMNTFQVKWTELLEMKREIDDATKSIQDNPLISLLTQQVRELNEMDNKVTSAYFSDGAVVVETRELTTNQRIDGHIKTIGRMRFVISLRPLIGSASRDNDPIAIKNLDRRFASSRNSIWECGHTPSEGAPCWGTAWPQLFSAFTRRELHEIVDILIRFITSPDPTDSWGSKIKGFPNFVATQAGTTLVNGNGGAAAGNSPAN